MSEGSSFLSCPSHPGESATARCTQCGKAFCRKCRVEDVGAEETFCSRACLEARRAARLEPTVLNDAALLEGANHPIRAGWRLWAHSVAPLGLYTAPLAVVMGLLASSTESLDANGEANVPDGVTVLLVAAFAFAIALTQVIICRQHTGRTRGNPYLWTLRRFIPWGATLTLAFAATALGFLALVIPGIYIGFRLFWADEFALTHEVNPIQALRDSWQLTKGNVADIFRFQFVAGLAGNLVLLGGILLLASLELVANALGNPSVLQPIWVIVSFLVIFIGYGALHSPEIVRLYGMRAEQAVSAASSTKTLGI